MNEKTFQFDGAAYRVLERRTMENDTTCMGLIRSARLDAVILEEGEAAEDFAARMVFKAMTASELYDLLGCLMVPAAMADLDWTPDIMRSTGAALRKVSDEAEKRQLTSLVLGLVNGFFRGGLLSLRTSRKSLSTPGVGEQPISEIAANGISATGS
jgi:hypothetical protein